MKLRSVFHKKFETYGRVVSGYDINEMLQVLEQKISYPEGVTYKAKEALFEEMPIRRQFQNNLYGGLPIQIGWCCGRNTVLNCLEYHKSSEINIGSTDFILLLALEQQIVDGKLDLSCVKAFYVPKGVVVELYGTTMHYAPCHYHADEFRTIVVLPEGTNLGKPEMELLNEEDVRLFAANKWLLAHPEAPESQKGAYVGLTGKVIDISQLDLEEIPL